MSSVILYITVAERSAKTGQKDVRIKTELEQEKTDMTDYLRGS